MPEHGVDVTAAVSGALFVVLGGLFLLDQLDVIVVAPRLVWPLLLIGLGIAVLAGSRRSRGDAPAEDGDSPAGTDDPPLAP